MSVASWQPGSRVSLSAHAKVNLGLAVLARRGDGFHQIETVMARLALADSVTVELLSSRPDDEGKVTLSVSGEARSAKPHPELTRSIAAVPSGSENIVVRAAEAYLAEWSRETSGSAPVVAVELVKRVPVAAGLGGGSSDAGATLRALAELLPGAVDIAGLAARLGSDVPFFAADRPAVLAKGRGERLTAVDMPQAHLVLAKPPVSVSAAEGYEWLLGFTPRLKYQQSLEALSRGEEPGWRNALQPGVSKRHPVVRELLALLREAGLRGCVMSGSGPTCFGVAADELEAAAVANDLARRRPDLWVAATRTL